MAVYSVMLIFIAAALALIFCVRSYRKTGLRRDMILALVCGLVLLLAALYLLAFYFLIKGVG